MSGNAKLDYVQNFDKYPSEQYLQPKQVAALLGISQSTLWLWTKQNKLPSPVRLGNKATRWTAGQIRTWQASRVGGE